MILRKPENKKLSELKKKKRLISTEHLRHQNWAEEEEVKSFLSQFHRPPENCKEFLKSFVSALMSPIISS